MHKRFRFGALFTTVTAVMLPAAPLSAATVYNIFAGSDTSAIGPCNGNSGPNTSLSSSSPVSATVNCSGSTGTLQSTATSSQGHVGGELLMNTSPSGPGESEADFFTQVIFSSINPNASQDPISIALNMAIAGTMTLTGSGVVSWSATAQLGSTPYSYSRSIDGTLGGSGLFFSSGGETLITNTSDVVGGILTTPTVSGVGLNTPIFVKITLDLFGFGNPGQLSAEFLNSLDFPTGSDVFTLPEGYTANASDVFLVNNRFNAPTSSAPEPATWLPLGAAIALLGRRLLRKTAY